MTHSCGLSTYATWWNGSDSVLSYVGSGTRLDLGLPGTAVLPRFHSTTAAIRRSDSLTLAEIIETAAARISSCRCAQP